MLCRWWRWGCWRLHVLQIIQLLPIAVDRTLLPTYTHRHSHRDTHKYILYIDCNANSNCFCCNCCTVVIEKASTLILVALKFRKIKIRSQHRAAHSFWAIICASLRQKYISWNNPATVNQQSSSGVIQRCRYAKMPSQRLIVSTNKCVPIGERLWQDVRAGVKVA